MVLVNGGNAVFVISMVCFPGVMGRLIRGGEAPRCLPSTETSPQGVTANSNVASDTATGVSGADFCPAEVGSGVCDDTGWESAGGSGC